jgi:phage terminase large subunit-like protein
MPRKKKLSRSERNVKWIESFCYVPEGKNVGKAFRLTPEQKQWLSDIYDSPTRTFILSMGRKNGKTAFSSVLLLLHLCGPEAKQNSQLYSDAQSLEQAAVLFRYASQIVRMSPRLSQFIEVRDSVKELRCPELGTIYKSLSADAKTKYGLSPIFVVHDELGQVSGPTSDLYQSIETGMAAHEHPLSIIISTQAPNDGDLLSILIDDAMTGADPEIKVRVYSAPKDMDAFSEQAIEQANPHYHVFMNKKEVRKQALNAQRMPSAESSYRNLILNQRVEARDPFVTEAIWKLNAKAPDTKTPQKWWGGLDLSSVNDLTAFVLVSENGDVVPTFWLPKEGLEEKSKKDRVPYDIWAKQGYLTTTPGRAIDYDFVAFELIKIFKTYDIQAVAFDRWNMKFLKQSLERMGMSEADIEKFQSFGQGFASMSPAIRELETRLLKGKLKHGGHPILEMCAHNATVLSDPAGNRKFIKGKTTGRIDGMVALSMAIGSMPQETETKTVQQGFISL